MTTKYILNSGETVQVMSIENLEGVPAQALYTLLILDGRNRNQEIRLTEREMKLNGATKAPSTPTSRVFSFAERVKVEALKWNTKSP